MCLPSSVCQGNSGELGLPGAIGEKVSIYSLAFYYETMQLLVIKEDETKYNFFLFSEPPQEQFTSLKVYKVMHAWAARLWNPR